MRTLIALCAALLLATSAHAAEKLKVLLSVTAVDEAFAPFLVAKELGYFAEEGIDVEFVPTAGSNQALLQTAAGNGDVGLVSAADLVPGVQPNIGMKVLAFYNVYYVNIWSVSVLPDSPVQSLSDLRGKKIGVASMGSSGVVYGKAYLQKAGVEIGKDGTSFLPIGVGAQGAAALRTRQVDAVVYWDAMLTKLEVGGLKLRQLPLDPMVTSLPDAALVSQIATLEKKPQLLAGVGRALAKGFVFNQANREAAVRITWKQYPESKPRNLSEEDALKSALYVNEARMKIWEPHRGARFGEFLKGDYDNIVAFAKDYGIVPQNSDTPLEKLYTNRFVDTFNTFDRDAVRKQAAAFDMKSLR